jgi:hypothetical protein
MADRVTDLLVVGPLGAWKFCGSPTLPSAASNHPFAARSLSLAEREGLDVLYGDFRAVCGAGSTRWSKAGGCCGQLGGFA